MLKSAHAMTGDGRFELRVSDSGTGISEDFLPYIFDRFSREETNNANTQPRDQAWDWH